MGEIGIENPVSLIELLNTIKRKDLIPSVRGFINMCEEGRIYLSGFIDLITNAAKILYP